MSGICRGSTIRSGVNPLPDSGSIVAVSGALCLVVDAAFESVDTLEIMLKRVPVVLRDMSHTIGSAVECKTILHTESEFISSRSAHEIIALCLTIVDRSTDMVVVVL